MDQFEEAALNYLCGPPQRFVNFQYNIPHDGFQGGSCPDFVVLDFGDSTIYIIEITAAADTKSILGRVAEREKRWVSPLRNHFAQMNSTFSNWEYHVTVFVREEEYTKVQERLREFRDVSVISLDKVVFSWRWQWVGSNPVNPLREAGKAKS